MWRSSNRDKDDLRTTWLVRLRWGTMVGQILFVAAVEWFMSVSVQLTAAAALIGAVGVSNVALEVGGRRVEELPEGIPFGVLALDVALFTGLLAVSGGASNPFSFLYILYIAVAALMLDGAYPWLVAGGAVAGYGSLYVGRIGLAAAEGAHTDVHRHLYGMWFALAVTGAMIAYFVNMIRRELERRGERLREMQEARSRRKRLASLATMAAGAAHELSTPISTIAVVANELRRLGERRGDRDVAEEAAVIRDEVDRCEEILDKMAAHSGRPPEAQYETISPLELARQAGRRAGNPDRVEIAARGDPERPLEVPAEALVENLAAVIDNGLRAAGEGEGVGVTVRRGDGEVGFCVEDSGDGMSREARRHAVEPFYTTREPGEGMGLGLFLARELAEGLGGSLTIDSEEGVGTAVEMTIPVDSDDVRGRANDE